MNGNLVGLLTGGRDVAYCRTEKVWHILSNQDDIKAEQQQASENEARRVSQLPVGSKIGNK